LNTDLEWKEKYSELVRIPFIWIDKAQELLYCAGLIYQSSTHFNMIGMHRTLSIFLMLYSYAFENLFKGLIMAQEAKEGLRTDVNDIKDHRLCYLVKRTGLDCTEEELSFLERLQYFGITQGRYQLPKDWQEYRKQQGGEFSKNDITQIASVMKKVEDKFVEVSKFRIDFEDFSFDYMVDNKTYHVERKIYLPYERERSNDKD
jgi:hypothetical protein